MLPSVEAFPLKVARALLAEPVLAIAEVSDALVLVLEVDLRRALPNPLLHQPPELVRLLDAAKVLALVARVLRGGAQLEEVSVGPYDLVRRLDVDLLDLVQDITVVDVPEERGEVRSR